MPDLKTLNMSELIALHNELAEKLGVATENSFKDMKAARAAIQTLEKKMEQAQDGTSTTQEPTGDTGAAATPPVAGDAAQKYNSSGKRGPNQGVGAYAKELILAGKNNADALAAVKAKFPDAKTTTGCIAFYRTALTKGPAGKTPEQLRAEAQALLDKAKAVEEGIAAKKAADDEKAAADALAAQQAAQTTQEPVTA